MPNENLNLGYRFCTKRCYLRKQLKRGTLYRTREISFDNFKILQRTVLDFVFWTWNLGLDLFWFLSCDQISGRHRLKLFCFSQIYDWFDSESSNSIGLSRLLSLRIGSVLISSFKLCTVGTHENVVSPAFVSWWIICSIRDLSLPWFRGADIEVAYQNSTFLMRYNNGLELTFQGGITNLKCC